MTRVLEIFGEPILHGGQEAFVLNVIQAMDMKDLIIDLLTPYQCKNEYYRTIVENLGGHIYSLNIPFNPGGSRHNLLRQYEKFLEKHRYDTVHIHSGSISVLMYASLAAKRTGIKKIIVHSHCAGDRKTLKYRLIKLASMPILSSCPTDYFACSKIAGEWKFPSNIVKDKLVIIKNGIDLNKFTYKADMSIQMRLKYGIPKDAFVVGHVGRFSFEKNHEYLIRVFKKTLEQIPTAYLLLVGEGELMNDVKKQVVRLNLTEKVVFTGSVNNVQDYFQMMNIFVLPSRWEGLPIVGVEAQAAGLPVLVSKNVSRELDLTGGIKFLSLSDDVTEWVDQICKLKNCVRFNNTESLIKKGFDINETAVVIRNKYCFFSCRKN